MPAQARLQELQALKPARTELPLAEFPESESGSGLAPELRTAYFQLLEQQLRGGSTGLRGVQARSESLRVALRSAHGALSQALLAFVLLMLLSSAALGLWICSEGRWRESDATHAAAAASSGLGALWDRLRAGLGGHTPRNTAQAGWVSTQPLGELAAGAPGSPHREVVRACQLMGELQQSVQSSTQAVERARLLSSGLGQQAGRCQQLMGEIVDQMQGLRTTVLQVRDLVLNVDSIAFETQVLAVHAALGGVQSGRHDGELLGAEVRALARRCAEAAHDVRHCMGEAADRIEQRGEQVFGAARALGEIVDSVERLAQITADVSFAGLIECRALENLGQALRGLETVLQGREASSPS